MNGNDSHNGEHHGEHHHGAHATPKPQLLFDKPTVTIRFDGLIYTAYNKKKQLYQAAVHTEAEEHQLTVVVQLAGQEKPLFPDDANGLKWDPSHAAIKKGGPFWLYVDSGNGKPQKDFSAKLYLPPDPKKDARSFDHILNFEHLYERKITLNPARFAEFNFPHGTCYSSLNTDAKVSKLDQKNNPLGGDEKDIMVSTLGAIDIDSVSAGEEKKHIVLENKDGKFFSFPLENGKHYVIEIINGPIPKAPPVGEHEHEEEDEQHDHEKHFLQFYELIPLNAGDPKFLVKPAVVPHPPTAPGSPPCIQGTGGREDGLP